MNDNIIRAILDTWEKTIPPDIRFYKIQDKILYEIRDSEGKIPLNQRISYLYTKKEDKYFRYAIEFRSDDSLDQIVDIHNKALESFQKELASVPIEFNPEAGDMGRASDHNVN